MLKSLKGTSRSSIEAEGKNPRLTNDDVTNLEIPIPLFKVQQAVVDEVRHRREEARRLRVEADAEWAAAKELFEAQLLGGPENEAVTT
jgi:hypothetical protein